jgi:flavin-dependent dehydrogenase
MHYRLRPHQAAALGDGVELFLYDGGYAGLQAIETDAANLCLVVTADRVRGRGLAWPNALAYVRAQAPALAARLVGARPLWPRPASIARIPYGYLCPEGGPEGLFRVGDQAAVIPSLAGEGIALALRSGRLAADAVLAGDPAARHASTIRHEVLGPLRRAGLIAALVRDARWRSLGLRLASIPGILPALALITRLRSSSWP